MDSVLKFVFKPLKIKSMEIENRIGMPSMHLNFTPNGAIGEKIISFYKERAKGGVGLIVIGGCSINDTAGGGHLIGLHSDKFIPGLKRLTEEIHKTSQTKIAAQLYHAGRYASSFFIGKQPVAPSPVASKLTKETPKELSIDEIKTIEDDFANAAYRAKISGFDSVEILGSAGYLISQFLSPLTNLRKDIYGGSFENRARFGVEVIKKVREAVGDDFPVMIRQGGSDFVRRSNTTAEILEAIKLFSKAGIDLINVTGGWHETHVPQIAGVVPNAGFAYLAYGIKKATGKPVIISNRVSTIELAAKLIRDGWGDMVNLGRPLIADPYLVNKAREDKTKQIIPCISCNQLCFDAVFKGKEVGCSVNPIAGKELLYQNGIKKADKTKNIAIIGAGAGGMSAAIYAAQRGYRVTVFEKKERIGGQLHIASAPSDKKEFSNLITYFENEAKRLNIKIVTNREIKAGDILKDNYDEIIVATGAKPIIPSIENIDSENVVKAEDVLSGQTALKDRVAIIGGGAVGVDAALYILEHSRINAEQAAFLLKWEAETCDKVKELATKGFKDITIIEMLDSIGKDIGKTTRWIALKELAFCGVKMITNAKAKKIEKDGIVIEDKDAKESKIPADTVVLAVGYKPENQLYNILKEKLGDRVHIIGDAEKVAKLPDAVHTGFKLAVEI